MRWPPWRKAEPTVAVEQRQGSQAERRSYTPPVLNFVRLGESYADVDLSKAEASLQSVAIHAAADLIASLVSERPLHVYVGAGVDRRERPIPGYLLDPAGDGYGLQDWSYQVMQSWLLRGNLYADILDASSSTLRQVMLHHPDCIRASLVDGQVVWTVDGKRVDNPDRFLHRPVSRPPGTILGVSPVALHIGQIGQSLRASRFGEQWFKDGAHPAGILTNEEADLGDNEASIITARFMAKTKGTREPVVMGRGWRYQTIQVSAEESQFLATQGFSEAQCARIFGPGVAEILGYDTGAPLTYANVESRMNHLLILTLDKWLRRMDRLLSEMVPSPQYVVLDRDSLLQSTTLDRYRSHSMALGNNPWATINERRAIENLPPVPWGDERLPAAPVGASQDDDPAKGAQ